MLTIRKLCKSNFLYPIEIRVDPQTSDSQHYAKFISAIPYRKSTIRILVYHFLSFSTLGLFPLVLYWFPLWYYKLFFVKTSEVLLASHLLIQLQDQNEKIVSCEAVTVSAQELRLCCWSFGEYLTEKPFDSENPKHLSALQDTREHITTVKFIDRYSPFIYNVWFNHFEPIQFNTSLSYVNIYRFYSKGIVDEVCRRQRLELYGRSSVEIELKPLYLVLFSEVFHPFHVFQIVAISLWLWDEYYQYAAAVILITVVSLIVEVREMRRTQRRLQGIAQRSSKVKVIALQADEQIEEIDSTDLVPGDVVLIENLMMIPCDMLLLQGSVIVNEDVLTGESLPVMKSPSPYGLELSSKHFISKDNNNRILFGGTRVITTKKTHEPFPCASGMYKNEPWALVLRTGFSTAQGRMLQSILYPPPNESISFKLETYKFLFMLSFLACLGSLLSAYFSYRKNLKFETILLRAIDSFSNAIPPSLIASMTVGCSIAVAKLNAFWRISCMEPSRINIVGQINTIVFDKTGTLTEEGLELESVSYSRVLNSETWTQEATLYLKSSNPPSFLFSSSTNVLSEIPQILVKAMATCHTVVALNQGLLGEPMEIQMLQFTGFSIRDQEEHLHTSTKHFSNKLTSVSNRTADVSCEFRLPYISLLYKKGLLSGSGEEENFFHDSSFNSDNQCFSEYSELLYAIKVFEFSSNLQRMSVIVWDKLHKQLWVFSKGSPEQMKELCLSHSIPIDFRETLRRFTETGMRVLVFAAKHLDAPDWVSTDHLREAQFLQDIVRGYTREHAEKDLWLLGLVTFNNKLRKEAKATIEMLMEAKCRCLMSTGDNPLTAIAVARSASLINPNTDLAILGDVVKLSGNGAEATPMVTWTPVSYSPTLASTSPRAGCLSSDIRVDLAEFPNLSLTQSNDVNSFTSFSSEIDQPCVVSLEDLRLCSFSSNLSSGSFTSAEIQKYLDHKDPRDVILVLTGAAFRVLKDQHHKLNLPLYEKASSASRWVNYLNISRKQKFFTFQEQKKSTSRVASTKRTSHKLPQSVPDLELGNSLHLNSFAASLKSPYMFRIAVDSSFYKELTSLRPTIHPLLKRRGLKGSFLDLFVKSNCISSASWDYSVNFKEELGEEAPKIPTECHREYIHMSFFEFCLRHCRVYARMSPDDKAELITSLRSLSNTPAILMCGDGANDCAALRVADSGLSLSEREASLAASFTSSEKHLGNVVDLLREARSALVNSFQSFKYIALYALLQLVTSVILYSYGGNLTDPQYLWVDLAVVFPLSMTMAWTYSSARLAPRLPLRRLVGLPVILSLCGQLAIQSAFTLLALRMLESSDFYVPYSPETNRVHYDPESLKGYENTVVFLVSCVQYVVTCLALSMGKPWRKPAYTNFIFTGITVTHLFLVIFFVLHPESISFLSKWLTIVDLPRNFRWTITVLILLNCLVTIFYEKTVIGQWATSREEKKDYLSRFIDGILPLNKAHRVVFSHDPY